MTGVDSSGLELAGGIAGHFKRLNLLAAETIEQTTSLQSGILGDLLRLESDVGLWEERIKSRPEARQLGDARREMGFATYAACSGLYRLAYSGVRTFLELSFAAVYFSANELHRRRWVSDRVDFSWSQALDRETGLLSKTFVQEFFPGATDEAATYSEYAAKCYRDCSQFVHGKLAVTQKLPEHLSYSDEVMTQWVATAHMAVRSTLFLLYIRYADELLANDDGSLESTLTHSFGHLKSVRASLGLPVEKG